MKLLSLLVASVLLTVGCVPSVFLPTSSIVTPAPFAPTPTPIPPTQVPTPVTTGSPGPAATSTAAPIPTPAPSDAAMTSLRVYFVVGLPDGTTGLVPVAREVPKAAAVGEAAMGALIAGPTAVEATGNPAAFSLIPPGTRFIGLTIRAAVATVDLSGEFASGGGTASVFARLAQVVYTLTQFSTVTSVRFLLDGVPVTTFSGEGVRLDKPAKRTDFSNELPALFVDRPAWGGQVGNPVTIQGYANVFEAQFTAQIRDGAGNVLSAKAITATCGTGCWGTFLANLPYSVSTAEWGSLRVYSASAKDGKPENERVYPIWLKP